MNKILVNEIFDSFQGEGHQQGMLCTFVRLQGCSVGCDFCDTKNTWTTSSKFKESKNVVLLKNEVQSSFYSSFTNEEILENCSSQNVVITGGEPFEQDIDSLLILLVNSGKKVFIETSGNSEIDKKIDCVWYTVSPKITKKTNLEVLLNSISKADELKIVPSASVIPFVETLVSSMPPDCILSFQPESCSEDSKKICLHLAKKYNARISIQVHKYTEDR